MNNLDFGLNSLPLLTNARTRSVSAENPTGEKGKGGMAIPRLNDPDLPHAGAAIDLGQGWKVRPFLNPKAGETLTIFDVDGPGVIKHIWITTDYNFKNNGRACVLRFYWDDEETPSIEVPMTDFCAVGHDLYAPINTVAVSVTPSSGLNCYWPMPFRKHAKITFTNEGFSDLDILAYQITYDETEVPHDAAYFHAQWRRSVTDAKNPDYTIVDGIKGKGKYVGTFLSWTQLSTGWFGEGEIKFYMDGDKEFPTICGTGTEDYFCSTYCFPENYATIYVGAIKHKVENGPPKWTLYRWHILDPICFDSDLKITIQALGWYPNRKYKPLEEDIASVAYWYQSEPHQVFRQFPPLTARWAR